MLEDIHDGQCFLYREAASDSTHVAVRVKVGDRRGTCIHLESGDYMTFDRANHVTVTPITITELKYTL